MTLTYDDQHLPLNPGEIEDENGDTVFSMDPCIPSVRKADLQKFHMDLRKRFQQGYYTDDTLKKVGFGDVERIPLPDTHFSYYCTSEYGPEGHRPHYHGFYMGLPEDPDITFGLFNAVWRKGYVYCEMAQSEKCAAYVAKYLVNTSLVPVSRFADRPFALMSKGLGSSYIENPDMVEWHRSDYLRRSYIPLKGSRQVMSRYLRDKVFDDGMKADILEAALDREQAAEEAFALLPDDEQYKQITERKHAQEEAVRQAEWRFRSKGKIK